VRSGTTTVLYTDGNPADSGTVNVGPVATDVFRVGAGLTGTDVVLDGRIAELVIVPRAVSASEYAQWRTYAKGHWAGLP